MYLERLDIQGFKSFANKNKLIFSGMIGKEKRGLTAIVGPNGSGKSNVADSIRWALGEQSLKTIRGKKSEDVIFSGSDKKGQLGMAEVSLVLNNQEAAKNKAQEPEKIDQEADLDQLILSSPEITITRRIYRSGESEYLLNNHRVRLSDIQMLLAKANFGQKTYSVIGQGMVENFLNTSAAERKDFFDEATGVKQFQIKRDSALNKLENSYENLQQVEMLLSEIRPRLKSLTRQVEKLKRRDEIAKELKDTQLDYYSTLWQEINGKLSQANGSFLTFEKEKIEKEKRLSKLSDDLNRIRQTDNYREMAELQPRLRELENQRQVIQKQLAKLQAELELQLEAQGQFDVSWLNNKLGELEAELAQSETEAKVLEAPQDNGASAREELQKVESELRVTYDKRRLADRLENEKLIIQKQIARLEATLEAHLEAQGQFDVSWLNNKSEELQAELSNLRSDLLASDASSSRSEEKTLSSRLEKIQSETRELNSELDKLDRELKKAPDQANAKALEELVREFISRLEAIEKETDLARLKQLIAGAKQDFKERMAAFNLREDDGRLMRVKEIQSRLISLAEEKQEVQDKLNAKRLEIGLAAERMRLLTEKEHQLERELKDIRSKLERANVKFDAGKIEEDKAVLAKQLSSLDEEQQAALKGADTSELEAKRRHLEIELNEKRMQAASIAERRRLLEAKQMQTRREITDIKAKLAKASVKFDATEIENSKRELSGKLEIIAQESKQIEDKLAALNAAQEKEKGEMYACQQAMAALQSELNDLVAKLNNLKVEAARQETKLEDLEANIRSDELQLMDIKNHRPAEGEMDRWQKNISNAKMQLEQIGGIDPETEKEFDETKERHDFLSNQTEDLDKAIKSLEQVIYELDLNIKDRFDKEFKLISEKFDEYFKILFNGGSAKISKVLLEDLEKDDAKPQAEDAAKGLSPQEQAVKKESDERLKRLKFLRKYNAVGLAGIEIQATPPGKKIQSVSMLSGGERALTAIALICAIISANPSPFVVLDEADAALDEANSERLAKILDDLSNRTQFIVITHNRASMRRASILYGVTMESDGVSKLLSVKLEEVPTSR